MREVDVVYLYEHAARELDVACAVTAILESEYNLNVEIVHWPLGFPEAVSRVRPRLVILPFCYSDQNFRMLLAYWREATFLNLAWEQFFYVGNRKAKSPHDEFPLRHVFHHTWSNEYAEFLKKAGVPEANIFVNGQPAYALYHEPYSRYFISRSALANRYGLDSSCRWVFFPENYNWAFYSDQMINQFVENGQSPEDIQVMREYCERSLEEMLRWCAQILKEHDVEIIVRPRPSTSNAKFLAFVKRILPEIPSKLHIVWQETVREWILASDMVVSSHSTSLIEAAVAGRYAGIVAPFPIPSQLHVDWHNLLPHISTLDEFQHIVAAPLNNEKDLGRWASESLLSRGDPIRNLTSYIMQLSNGKIKPLPCLPKEIIASWFKLVPPVWIWGIYRRVKLFWRHPASGGIDPLYEKDYMTQRELRVKVQKWKSSQFLGNQG